MNSWNSGKSGKQNQPVDAILGFARHNSVTRNPERITGDHSGSITVPMSSPSPAQQHAQGSSPVPTTFGKTDAESTHSAQRRLRWLDQRTRRRRVVHAWNSKNAKQGDPGSLRPHRGRLQHSRGYGRRHVALPLSGNPSKLVSRLSRDLSRACRGIGLVLCPQPLGRGRGLAALRGRRGRRPSPCP